jgi:hypothetical protein
VCEIEYVSLISLGTLKINKYEVIARPTIFESKCILIITWFPKISRLSNIK